MRVFKSLVGGIFALVACSVQANAATAFLLDNGQVVATTEFSIDYTPTTLTIDKCVFFPPPSACALLGRPSSSLLPFEQSTLAGFQQFETQTVNGLISGLGFTFTAGPDAGQSIGLGGVQNLFLFGEDGGPGSLISESVPITSSTTQKFVSGRWGTITTGGGAEITLRFLTDTLLIGTLTGFTPLIPPTSYTFLAEIDPAPVPLPGGAVLFATALLGGFMTKRTRTRRRV